MDKGAGLSKLEFVVCIQPNSLLHNSQ